MAIAFKDDYLKMDEKYEGQTYKMSANTLLTWPADIDGSRLYMSTAETKQSLTLLNPDFPRISTGWENPLGRLNADRSFKRMNGTWEVMDIIKKFRNGEMYTIVFYNHDTDTYEMIEKQIAENLIEKFGYVFDTERMDQLKIGEVITDEVIYKSTAYDKNMNYCYGKNAKVIFSTSTGTLEDAVLIRQGWADGVKSVEVDTVNASVNNNHIPLNLYGDDENYQVCPKFGEPIKNSTVFALRSINKEHILVDFQNKNLQKITSADTEFYVSEADISYIYDIDIYYNNPEPFPDNIFFRQLKEYYDDICNYAEKMLEWTVRIKESGSKYTNNIPFFKSKYQHWNDPEWKWCGKEKNKPFGNMIVEFHVKSIIGLGPGSKMAGRCGDKGVISKVVEDPNICDMVTDTMDSILDMLGREINEEERTKLASQIVFVPDDQMPYTDDFPVDILANASGAVRRLNPEQIVEVDLNFQAEAIRKKVTTLETMEEKENMIFDFLSMLSEDHYSFFFNLYKGFDKEYRVKGKTIQLQDRAAKEAFIRDVEEHGFYLVKELDSNIRYKTITDIYDHFDFIKPLPIYIDIFGTKRRRILKDAIVADKYFIILKHNNNKNFSARSTFRVNRANLPAKDTTKRNNRSQYSKSPVRIGEGYNLMSAISGRLLAEYNIFMRSSTLGRKSLKQILETEGNPLEIKRLKVKDNYINANADIFNARLKGIGLELEFVKEDMDYETVIEDVIMPLQIGKFTIYDSPLRKPMYNKIFAKYISAMESVSVVQTYPGEKKDIVWKHIFELPEIKEYNLSEDEKEMIILASKHEGIDIVKELKSMKEEDIEEPEDDEIEDEIIEEDEIDEEDDMSDDE